MLLGTKPHTAGNHIQYRVDYARWLDPGVSLSAAPAPTIALSAAFTATVTDVTISGITVVPSKEVLFTLSGGSANETFTLDVQVTDSRGEIKKDTLGFTVVAP